MNIVQFNSPNAEEYSFVMDEDGTVHMSWGSFENFRENDAKTGRVEGLKEALKIAEEADDGPGTERSAFTVVVAIRARISELEK